jgi:hypothetical protein
MMQRHPYGPPDRCVLHVDADAFFWCAHVWVGGWVRVGVVLLLQRCWCARVFVPCGVHHTLCAQRTCSLDAERELGM